MMNSRLRRLPRCTATLGGWVHGHEFRWGKMNALKDLEGNPNKLRCDIHTVSLLFCFERRVSNPSLCVDRPTPCQFSTAGSIPTPNSNFPAKGIEFYLFSKQCFNRCVPKLEFGSTASWHCSVEDLPQQWQERLQRQKSKPWNRIWMERRPIDGWKDGCWPF